MSKFFDRVKKDATYFDHIMKKSNDLGDLLQKTWQTFIKNHEYMKEHDLDTWNKILELSKKISKIIYRCYDPSSNLEERAVISTALFFIKDNFDNIDFINVINVLNELVEYKK